MPAACHTIEIDAPPNVVMGVLTDFAAYPGFLPETETTEILHMGKGEWEVRFTIKVIRRLEYTLRLVQEDSLRLSWSLIEGVFQNNDGGWTLQSLDDGARTHAEYKIDLQVGMFVPGNIVRSLVQRTLPDTMQRFKAEAERRHRA